MSDTTFMPGPTPNTVRSTDGSALRIITRRVK